jgi:GNAT superfamily N-acetyltransferase
VREREVTVRRATPADIGKIVPAYEWLFASPGSRPPRWESDLAAERLSRAMASREANVLVAVRRDELVGLCTAYLDLDSVRFGRRVWVEDLAVDPGSRSQGIGKRLLESAKEWAREQGATHLELDTAEARIDAQRFYERERPSWRSKCYGWQL